MLQKNINKKEEKKELIDKREALPVGIIVFMFILSFYYYGELPGKIPSYWNAEGKIDAYSSKWTLVLIPFVTLGIYLFFLLIPKIAVFKENVVEFYARYMLGFKTIIVFFFGIFLVTLSAALGRKIQMNYFMFPAIAVLFFYIGSIIQNAKRNFFIGIRTPWTLANDTVWEKTHKVGGKLFQLIAFIFLIFF